MRLQSAYTHLNSDGIVILGDSNAEDLRLA